MEHGARHHLPQEGLLRLIWKFSCDHTIDVFAGDWTCSDLKHNKDVSVWESSLLIFHHKGSCRGLAKNMPFVQIMEQSSKFEMKYPCHEIWPVIGRLTREQCQCDRQHACVCGIHEGGKL